MTILTRERILAAIGAILLGVLVLFAAEASGQTPNSSTPKPPQTATVRQERRFRLDWTDGIYWMGSIADVASSQGHREGNPFLRNPNGGLSTGKAFAIKGGLFGALKALDYFYPEHPRVMRWTKIIIGGAFAAVAVHNTRVK